MPFLPILNIDSDNLPNRLLVVGDPNRIDKVIPHLTDVSEISHNREYRCIKGKYNGQEIGVASHGVGSAGAGACFEELCQSGADRIVRAGSAGGMQPDVQAGDIVIASAAVREDGLSHKLAPPTFPAVASVDIIIAMRDAAKQSALTVKEGVVLTSDLFYPHDVLGSDLPLWQRAGVTAVEMEISALFTICMLHKVECGAVVAIDGNPLDQDDGSMETYNPRQENVQKAVEDTLRIALDSLIS